MIQFYSQNHLNQLHLSLDDQLHLFVKIVYSSYTVIDCKVRGYINVDIIERIYVKFCKLLFHLQSSTPSYTHDIWRISESTINCTYQELLHIG